jgi:hypothetical protein
MCPSRYRVLRHLHPLDGDFDHISAEEFRLIHHTALHDFKVRKSEIDEALSKVDPLLRILTNRRRVVEKVLEAWNQIKSFMDVLGASRSDLKNLIIEDNRPIATEISFVSDLRCNIARLLS